MTSMRMLSIVVIRAIFIHDCREQLGICIADVAGKGVSAALLMSNVQAAVRAYANESQSPAQVCGKVNRLLCENIATGKFVTFFYGILDGDARSFQYCNAGHLYPILVSRGSVGMLEQGGAVLGVLPAWTYEDSVIDLKAGDRLLLFTDGITKASDTNGQEFEETRIAAFAKANATLSASELDNRLLAQVTDFCGAHFQDDATLLSLPQIKRSRSTPQLSSRLAAGSLIQDLGRSGITR